MTSNNEHILVTLARQQFMNTERETVHLVNEPEINAFLNDIEQYPYAYVLACLMDRLIKAEKSLVDSFLHQGSGWFFHDKCLGIKLT
jgi:hypothetical protein